MALCRSRLRAVAVAVAKERRPRVLSLESVTPLVLGEKHFKALKGLHPAHQTVVNSLWMGGAPRCICACRLRLGCLRLSVCSWSAGGQWLPDMKELAGGADDWQMATDASCRITWEQVRCHRPAPGCAPPCRLQQASAPSTAHLMSLPGYQVREYAPEVLIVAPCGARVEAAREEACQLAGLPGWWNLPAVRTARVYVCDHTFFSRPGPR